MTLALWLAVAVLALAQTVTILALALFVRAQIRGITARARESLCQFVTAPTDTEPSPLAQLADQLAVILGSRVAQSIEARLLAHKSHVARQANALAEDVVQDAADQANPALGAILGALPSVKRRVARNPSALEAIIPIVSKLLGGAPPGASAKSNGDGSYQQRLRLIQ